MQDQQSASPQIQNISENPKTIVQFILGIIKAILLLIVALTAPFYGTFLVLGLFIIPGGCKEIMAIGCFAISLFVAIIVFSIIFATYFRRSFKNSGLFRKTGGTLTPARKIIDNILIFILLFLLAIVGLSYIIISLIKFGVN